ncbi:FecR family protein [Chitinophaga sp. YR573]|uniref:FecR family protein n=1 Tax=Chitinophaga sp. YR573 TaxID=1881040 RepID=UPI0008D4460D|nr:FecR family protein [Chitinophaga sp. YR573]SEW39436.1 FecR family protein [Chitinophaga sp. YR573]
MKPDEILINKFYSGTCTPEEAKLVMDWFMENEQTEDWEDETPNKYETEMLAVIRANTFGTKIIKLWPKVAVAASVLLIASPFFMKMKKEQPAKQIATTKVISNWTSITAANKMNIRLKDGSAIVLEKGATMRYDSIACRTIYLDGKALFTVAANEQKPFTVKTKGYSTIALGTSFMVSAEKGFRVKLFSGKVLIRTNSQKDIYLQPGEELAYNKIIRVSHKPEIIPVKRKSISIENNNMVFDNAPLKDVLELFKEKYHITIQYDEQNISGVYFTGQVLPTDKIELILKTIARINNLTLTSKDGTYIIL